MIIRTYFDKNNTLIYNSTVNTAKNPVTELFYGGDPDDNTLFSRYIFQFDVQRIIDFRSSGMYPDISKFTHTLKMTNTGAFDKTLLGDTTGDGKERTTSFDLRLFPINQDWDEGVGYDFAAQCFFNSVDGTVINNNPSNWIESSTGTAWANGGGVFTDWSGVTATTSVYYQHFADGNENLEIDITNIVNSYLTGGTNYGLGIAYDETLEGTDTDYPQYVGFFSRHTQTFYEPFVESRYDNQIIDARGNFYMDKLNKLYLYINVGGTPTDVDTFSAITATVYDNDGEVFSAFTSSGITHESQGIYSIELLVPTTASGCVLYEDIWSGITINGVERPGIELEFELKDSSLYYNIGSDATQSKNYTFNINGVKDNEDIKRGDIRKIGIMARVPYSVNQQEVLDSLEYRLYIKEGRNEYTVIDYTPVDLAFNYNFFLLDTASLLPQTYYLDVKATSNYEVKTTKNLVRFNIVSQVDERTS